MSRLGQQMFFARKRSANVAAAEGFVCAKAQRQQQHDVGHEGVITGRDALSLRSSIANPQGVPQSPLQSTLTNVISGFR
ncbi:hypothetical protein [Lysinibacillus xylanilyticus]|uniref:hypothetical protein n=1 Tax=Lysinibacillus xylanilyticus TaxID=582475 RepID=UPI00083C9D02|nr:hypothetical protein [Lysinibacillus xylanilyticus]